jgi:hypothetical protein
MEDKSNHTMGHMQCNSKRLVSYFLLFSKVIVKQDSKAECLYDTTATYPAIALL